MLKSEHKDNASLSSSISSQYDGHPLGVDFLKKQAEEVKKYKINKINEWCNKMNSEISKYFLKVGHKRNFILVNEAYRLETRVLKKKKKVKKDESIEKEYQLKWPIIKKGVKDHSIFLDTHVVQKALSMMCLFVHGEQETEFSGSSNMLKRAERVNKIICKLASANKLFLNYEKNISDPDNTSELDDLDNYNPLLELSCNIAMTSE